MATALNYYTSRVVTTDGIADGGSVYVYQSGTTTVISLYTDAAATIPAPNPYILSAGAQFPTLYYTYTGNIRLYIVTTTGAIEDRDPYVFTVKGGTLITSGLTASATNIVFGRQTAGAGNVEEIPCTSFGRAVIAGASAAAQRTSLGLAAIAASASATDLTAGTVAVARLPALTGDVTASIGTGVTAIAPSAVTLAQMANLATVSLLGNSTGAPATPQAITLNANALSFTGTVLGFPSTINPAAVACSSTLTTSWGGVGLGYGPASGGTGGAVVQATSKITAVTLNRATGRVTMNAAALAAAALVTFTVNNTACRASDVVILNLASGPVTAGTYRYWIETVAVGSFSITVENRSAGSLSEALVFNYSIIQGQIN